MQSILADFPLVRTCPRDTLRRVREIDPTAEVLYLGPRQWVVGPVKPGTLARGSQVPVLQSLLRIPQKKRTAAWHRRVLLARAKEAGFRPCLIHQHNDADGELVEDFHAAVFQLRMDYLAEMDAQEAAQKAALDKDLTDPGRAREAWRYAFTRNFSASLKAGPQSAPTSSVRTVHTLPSAS